MQIARQELTNMGLNATEAGVYVAALGLGKASIQEIAKKAHLNRTTLYPAITAMCEKGLLRSSISGKRTLYAALAPHELERLFQEKLKRFEGIVPELVMIARNSVNTPNVSFYEGIEGIKKAYIASSNATSKEIRAFVGVERLTVRSKILDKFWNGAYLNARLQNEVKGYIIIPDNTLGREFKSQDKKALRETRMVPATQYNFGGEILMYDSTVLFISYSENEEFVLSLNSPAISMMLQMIWKIVWTAAY